MHLPFCSSICYYCGCNKVITRDHGRSAKYLRYLERELDLVTKTLNLKTRRPKLKEEERKNFLKRQKDLRVEVKRMSDDLEAAKLQIAGTAIILAGILSAQIVQAKRNARMR